MLNQLIRLIELNKLTDITGSVDVDVPVGDRSCLSLEMNKVNNYKVELVVKDNIEQITLPFTESEMEFIYNNYHLLIPYFNNNADIVF